jgi:hypothetical protein
MSGNVWKVVIPNFENKVPVSKRRRAKYFNKKKVKVTDLPNKHQKYISTGKYLWDKKGYLVDDKGNRVLANPLVAGKPKFWTINGQRIYDGSLNYHVRAFVARWVHSYLKPYIEELPTFKLKEGEYLRVWIDLYKPGENQNWDCDNLWPWTKWFMDTLVECGKVPDDSIEFVRSCGQISYVESVDERKLVFNIQII